MNDVPAAEHETISAIFAYGTLKQGQCRERCWPIPALLVESGTIRGALWDLGPYPGLTTGDDQVRGEIWYFTRRDILRTLQALDAVEGFNRRSNDWFVRQAVYARTEAGQSVAAWVYFYARTLLSTARRALPAADGTVSWP